MLLFSAAVLVFSLLLLFRLSNGHTMDFSLIRTTVNISEQHSGSVSAD